MRGVISGAAYATCLHSTTCQGATPAGLQPWHLRFAPACCLCFTPRAVAHPCPTAYGIRAAVRTLRSPRPRGRTMRSAFAYGGIHRSCVSALCRHNPHSGAVLVRPFGLLRSAPERGLYFIDSCILPAFSMIPRAVCSSHAGCIFASSVRGWVGQRCAQGSQPAKRVRPAFRAVPALGAPIRSSGLGFSFSTPLPVPP